MTTNTLQTQREGLYNIVTAVKDAVRQSGVADGVCVIYCPHTTAGITINENADPDVVRDMLLGLDKTFPDRAEFRHMEGNSSAHLKASCIGSSTTVIIGMARLYWVRGRVFISANLTAREHANIM